MKYYTIQPLEWAKETDEHWYTRNTGQVWHQIFFRDGRWELYCCFLGRNYPCGGHASLEAAQQAADEDRLNNFVLPHVQEVER